jgi:ATP-dependent Zn protease
MDRNIEALLNRLYDRTKSILGAHLPALEALAKALLDRETLDGEEALDVLRENGLEPPLPLAD